MTNEQIQHRKNTIAKVCVILLVFRKSLIITPLLKVMVDVFYDENKERNENDEDNAEAV